MLFGGVCNSTFAIRKLNQIKETILNNKIEEKEWEKEKKEKNSRWYSHLMDSLWFIDEIGFRLCFDIHLCDKIEWNYFRKYELFNRQMIRVRWWCVHSFIPIRSGIEHHGPKAKSFSHNHYIISIQSIIFVIVRLWRKLSKFLYEHRALGIKESRTE